jgi:hypothetical protein
MRWRHSVGLVRWCRIGPRISEILSGGVGFVRWCRIGLWDFPWDFLKGNRRVRVHIGEPTPPIRLSACAVNAGLSDAYPGRSGTLRTSEARASKTFEVTEAIPSARA